MSRRNSQMRSRRMIPAALLAMGLAFAVAECRIVAQDALGRGDALDANPGVGTGGRNIPAPTPDFRARNLLITGDVAGGRHFRDSVGYRADMDFRGDLGSDDIFRFRADTALSSPRFAGLGRVADPFRFGQDLAMLEYRRLPVADYRMHRPDGLSELDRRITAVPGDDRLMAERFSERMLTIDPLEVERLRAMQLRTEQARPVGLAMSQEGDWLIASASPLHGITFRDQHTESMLLGISEYDLARMRDDLVRGRAVRPVGMPPDPSFTEQLRVMEPQLADRETVRMEDESLRIDGEESPHVEILKRIAQRYAGVDGVLLSLDAAMLEQLDDEFSELRQTLQELRMPRDVAPDERTALGERLLPWDDEFVTPPDDDEEVREARPDLPDLDKELQRLDPLLREPRRVRRPGDEEEDERVGLRRAEPMPIEEIIELLRHGQLVDRLAPADGSRVNELILSGQSSLRRGEYFTAESYFGRALRLHPEHPMASVGIVHAQLGAGLIQAASVTLRQTLSRHPELIDARFDARLLPRPEHLAELIGEIDAGLADDTLSGHYGLLLAYIGYQRSDRIKVERGLNAIEKFRPDDRLLPILRGIWLAEESEQPGK